MDHYPDWNWIRNDYLLTTHQALKKEKEKWLHKDQFDSENVDKCSKNVARLTIITRYWDIMKYIMRCFSLALELYNTDRGTVYTEVTLLYMWWDMICSLSNTHWWTLDGQEPDVFRLKSSVLYFKHKYLELRDHQVHNTTFWVIIGTWHPSEISV